MNLQNILMLDDRVQRFIFVVGAKVSLRIDDSQEDVLQRSEQRVLVNIPAYTFRVTTLASFVFTSSYDIVLAAGL